MLVAVRWFGQAGPRDPCRPLLGLLLRSAFALAVTLVTEVDDGKEVLRVVGALVAHDVARPPDCLSRGELLETRLVVTATWTGYGFGDPIAQAPQDEVACGRKITIEIDRGNDGFERVGEDRLLGAPTGCVFAFTEQEIRTEIDLLSDLREHA